MFAWYEVYTIILSCIVVCIYSSNNCVYRNGNIKCNGEFDYMPLLSNTLSDYIWVCLIFIKF